MHLQVKVEGTPGGGLMLRHRGDDGDVVLGVGRIQEGVETSSPGRDLCLPGSGNIFISYLLYIYVYVCYNFSNF